MKKNKNTDNQNSSENNNEELDADLQNASGGWGVLVVPLASAISSTFSQVEQNTSTSSIKTKLDWIKQRDQAAKEKNKTDQLNDQLGQKMQKLTPEQLAEVRQEFHDS